VLLPGNYASGLQFAMDKPVDLDARGIIRGDNQRVFWGLAVALRYCSHALLWIGKLVHPSLLGQVLDCFAHFAAGELLHGFPKQRVSLTDDLIKLGGVHSGLLELLEWLSGFNSLVLARVSHEDHAVSGV